MTEYEKKDLNRANNLATWSFIGIFIPILGFVLAGLSRSYLKELPPSLEERRVRRKSGISILLSIVAMLLGIVLTVAFYVILQQPNNTADTTTQQQIPQYDYQAGQQRVLLNNCLDSVDEWYNNNIQNVTTIYQEQNLLTQKQQEIDECKLRYSQ